MKKKLYLVTQKGRATSPCPKHRKPWRRRPPRKDGPEPVHSRYHRRIAPAHDRKRAA